MKQNQQFNFVLETEIINLLRQALVKIPLLPYSLALEKWRWNVMAGHIKPNEYNRAWWDLKLKYMGKIAALFLLPKVALG